MSLWASISPRSSGLQMKPDVLDICPEAHKYCLTKCWVGRVAAWLFHRGFRSTYLFHLSVQQSACSCAPNQSHLQLWLLEALFHAGSITFVQNYCLHLFSSSMVTKLHPIRSLLDNLFLYPVLKFVLILSFVSKKKKSAFYFLHCKTGKYFPCRSLYRRQLEVMRST